MNKRSLLFRPIILVLTALCVGLSLLSVFFNLTYFYISAAAVLAVLVYLFFYLKRAEDEVEDFVRELGTAVNRLGDENIAGFSMPVVVLGESGEIYWYNDRFAALLESEGKLYGKNFFEFAEPFDLSAPCPETGLPGSLKGRKYSFYTGFTATASGEKLTAVYMADDEELKNFTELYRVTRPAVLLINIDNFEDFTQSVKESERLRFLGKIELEIERFAEENSAVITKAEKDRFVLVMEDRALEKVLAGKFDVLDRVREISSGDRVPSTLSIGVSRAAASFAEGHKEAVRSLDMALGRGGDQAAIKTDNGYEFYGGISKGVEKRTKVKTRIIASALRELILTADRVIVMGHSFADLDAFGSAVGILKSVTDLGKTGHIAIRKNKNLVGPLYDRLVQNGYPHAFVEPEVLMDSVTDRTLLIITDTHIEYFLESPELYRKCKNVVVIDHHRKMVDHINNAVIFYHEPYASSASEMVTELVQYFGEEVKITPAEAEALLSGIMLDTKNFVLKTGVRTFEAAAYLRKQGADTVDVRKLFSYSLDAYRQRTRLVSSAEIYRGCAIADSMESDKEDIKIVAPQAADELLNINDVDASFVLYEYDGGISLSARSMGRINVQLIMEKLGGGGHLTMAGAQLAESDLQDARSRLLQAIDDYLGEK